MAGVRLRMQLKGMKGVQRALNKATGAYKGAMTVAVYQMGLEIMAAAVKQVPIKVKFLRDSRYVTLPTLKGVVELGFGTKYAVAQHENKHYKHPREGTRTSSRTPSTKPCPVCSSASRSRHRKTSSPRPPKPRRLSALGQTRVASNVTGTR